VRYLLGALLALPCCVSPPSGPALAPSIDAAGVTLPVDSPEKLARLLRQGRFEVFLSPGEAPEAGGGQGVTRVFHAGGAIALVDDRPELESPAIQVIAPVDVDRFAQALFAGEEDLDVRSVRRGVPATTEAARVILPPGALPPWPAASAAISLPAPSGNNAARFQRGALLVQWARPNGTGFLAKQGQLRALQTADRMELSASIRLADLYVPGQSPALPDVRVAHGDAVATALRLRRSDLVRPQPSTGHNIAVRARAVLPTSRTPISLAARGTLVAAGTLRLEPQALDAPLYLVDFSAAAPVVTPVALEGDDVPAVAFAGELLYAAVTGDHPGIAVVQVPAGATPSVVGFVGDPQLGVPVSLSVSGGTLLVGNGDGHPLRVYSVADPTRPLLVGTWTPKAESDPNIGEERFSPIQVAVAGPHAAVTSGHRTWILSTAPPDTPVPALELAYPDGHVTALAMAGESPWRVALGAEYGGAPIRFYSGAVNVLGQRPGGKLRNDHSGGGEAEPPVASFSPGRVGRINGLAAQGDRLACACDEEGIVLIDFAQPSQPVELARLVTPDPGFSAERPRLAPITGATAVAFSDQGEVLFAAVEPAGVLMLGLE